MDAAVFVALALCHYVASSNVDPAGQRSHFDFWWTATPTFLYFPFFYSRWAPCLTSSILAYRLKKKREKEEEKAFGQLNEPPRQNAHCEFERLNFPSLKFLLSLSKGAGWSLECRLPIFWCTEFLIFNSCSFFVILSYPYDLCIVCTWNELTMLSSWIRPYHDFFQPCKVLWWGVKGYASVKCQPKITKGWIRAFSRFTVTYKPESIKM